MALTPLAEVPASPPGLAASLARQEVAFFLAEPMCATGPCELAPSQSEQHPASWHGWKRGAEEEGLGGEKQPKVSCGHTAASSPPVMLCQAAGPCLACPSPANCLAINLAAGAGKPITSGLKSNARQVPGSRFQPWARSVASPAGPVPLPAPFYRHHSLEAEMAGQAMLALLLLLGELSANTGVVLQGGKGPRCWLLRSVPPRHGVPWGLLLPPARGGCAVPGGLGQIQPSKTLLWAPLAKVRL